MSARFFFLDLFQSVPFSRFLLSSFLHTNRRDVRTENYHISRERRRTEMLQENWFRFSLRFSLFQSPVFYYYVSEWNNNGYEYMWNESHAMWIEIFHFSSIERKLSAKSYSGYVYVKESFDAVRTICFYCHVHVDWKAKMKFRKQGADRREQKKLAKLSVWYEKGIE